MSPADKDEVVGTAEGDGAPQELVQRMRNASSHSFNTPDVVLRAV